MKEPAADRAKQFAPFAALSGFEKYIEAHEHIAVPRPALAEDEVERINELLRSLGVGDRVRLRVYSDDALFDIEGILRGIDPILGTVKIDKRAVALSDIVDIDRLK